LLNSEWNLLALETAVAVEHFRQKNWRTLAEAEKEKECSGCATFGKIQLGFSKIMRENRSPHTLALFCYVLYRRLENTGAKLFSSVSRIPGNFFRITGVLAFHEQPGRSISTEKPSQSLFVPFIKR
jgi:hypothetical protein